MGKMLGHAETVQRWSHPMPKIARELSALEVGRLKAPGLVSVGGVPGLSLQVTPTGARSWILRVKVGSKRRDMGLGAFPGVTLAKAREKAREARELIEQGSDPILIRERAQSQLRANQAGAVTFKEAAISFITLKTPEWRNLKHAAQWGTTLEAYAFPVIGALHVQDVHDTHILRILEPIWQAKTATATRLRGRIESILDWATAKKYRQGENPARWRGHLEKLLSSPKKTTAVVHHEAISVDSAPSFYHSLRKRAGFAARALEFVLLTASRSGEVRGAKWSEIDLTRGVWTVPGSRMKAGKEHRSPLSKSALEILSWQPKIEGCDLVFPSPRGGALSDMALTAVMRRMELTAVPHGLRSTFRDWAGDHTNFPRDLAEMALAHKVSDETEAAYRRSDMLERRRAMMQAWADFLSTLPAQ
jgi:integrase